MRASPLSRNVVLQGVGLPMRRMGALPIRNLSQIIRLHLWLKRRATSLSGWTLRSSRGESWTPRACILLLILLGAPGNALLASDGLDPQRDIDQYGHRVWTSQNGIPGEAVYQVVQ